MKKLILTCILLAFGLALHAQSKSVASLYEKYKDREDFFHMELGGNFMNFAKGFKIDLDEDDMAMVAKSVEKLNFFTLPEDGNQVGMELKALQKGLEKERYELLMEASGGKDGILIYSKGNNIISDLVVMVGSSGSNLMVVELKGNFDQETIAKATSYSSKGFKGAK